MQRSLEQKTRRLRECEDRLRSHDTHWIVRRGELELTGSQLGVGGWATVTVAKFRGAEVAVKRIHNQIVSHHNIQLFQREMNMASRLHHPNLVHFLGATMEGEMMIVMELMSTSCEANSRRMCISCLHWSSLSASMWPELSHIFIKSSQMLLFIATSAVPMFFLNICLEASGELKSRTTVL